jgi:hypothetical protein
MVCADAAPADEKRNYDEEMERHLPDIPQQQQQNKKAFLVLF